MRDIACPGQFGFLQTDTLCTPAGGVPCYQNNHHHRKLVLRGKRGSVVFCGIGSLKSPASIERHPRAKHAPISTFAGLASET